VFDDKLRAAPAVRLNATIDHLCVGMDVPTTRPAIDECAERQHAQARPHPVNAMAAPVMAVEPRLFRQQILDLCHTGALLGISPMQKPFDIDGPPGTGATHRCRPLHRIVALIVLFYKHDSYLIRLKR
jgi:hypothetical protein